MYVSSLPRAKAFYVDFLGLPALFEDEIIVVIGNKAGVVLHRNDRGHDKREIFPV